MSTRNTLAVRIFTHLLNSKQQALIGQSCVYYDPNTTPPQKCAIGCILTYPSKASENKILALSTLSSFKPACAPSVFKTLTAHISLFQELQNIHDACPPYTWLTQLRKISKTHHIPFNFQRYRTDPFWKDFWTDEQVQNIQKDRD